MSSYEDRDEEEGLLTALAGGPCRICCDTECFWRSCLHLGFLCCLISAWLVALTPWALALTEDGVMLLLYALLIPDALFVHKPWSDFHYSTTGSLEDVLLFSLLRCLAVFAAYGATCGQQNSKPYRVTAHIFGTTGLLFIGIKAIITRRQPSVIPRLVLLLTSAAFSVLHMVCAEGMERVLQMRAKYPAAPQPEAAVGFEAPPDDDEVPASRLMEPDSRFVECGPLLVHYKLARPQGTADKSGETIVLIHGFGAGVFAWRHVQQALANLTGRAVLAFDRPAFGLTSRYLPLPGDPSPYTLRAQAQLVVRVCRALGLMRLVLVGHSDGALLALIAAAQLKSVASPPTPPPPPSRHGSESDWSASGSLLEGSSGGGMPELVGLALLQPCFSGRLGRDLTRYKGWKGVTNLRRTLRSHLVDLIIRSGWADPAGFTSAVKHMYEAPFYIRDWDTALLMLCEQDRGVSPADAGRLCDAVRGTPALLVLGAGDAVGGDAAMTKLVTDALSCAVLSLPCGHFSNEEQPAALVQALAAFVTASDDAASEG